MSDAQRILEAMKGSGIKRVAFVDDAFDPPEIPKDQEGPLLDFLQAQNATDIRESAGIEATDWHAAIADLGNGTDESLRLVLRKLYEAYLRNFEGKFDPMGQFVVHKGGALNPVRPLLTLIRQADPEITVTLYGKEMDAVDKDFGPNVVFVDLFLDPGISPDDLPKPAEAQSAVEASIARIKPLLTLKPSVILMSSHSGTAQEKGYRKAIGREDRVLASRFRFVDKRKFEEAGATIKVDPDAGDVLLDLFKTYKFGRGLHSTLNAWVKSAKEAVTQLEDEIDGLDLADLAYLVRFRLAKEGQSLPDYLEWLLGECLVDQVGRQLDVVLPAAESADLGEDEAKRVENAFAGPTERVAALYHRVRVENKRARQREHFRLGDLYVRKRGQGAEDLVVLMTPDCDLVRRPGEAKPAAHAALTLQGSLQDFNAPSTSVGDFILIEEKPRNIKWNYRIVETMPFDGVMAHPGQDGEVKRSEDDCDQYRYIGALRPLYAQEIQANLLTNLGRVGVAVAPALAFDGQVKFVYFLKSGKAVTPEIACTATPAYVVSPRQPSQKPTIVFTRPFVRGLIKALEVIDATALNEVAADQLKWMLGDIGKAALESLSGSGLALDDTIRGGLLLTDKKPKLGNGGLPWCCIEVSMKWEQPSPTSAPPAVAPPNNAASAPQQPLIAGAGGETAEPSLQDTGLLGTRATPESADDDSDPNRKAT
jgi:hypothetical protein